MVAQTLGLEQIKIDNAFIFFNLHFKGIFLLNLLQMLK
jgi:hypothetical protein